MADEFCDFVDDDSEEVYEFDHYMNVRAFLQAHFGGSLGSRIYNALKRNATKLAALHNAQNKDDDAVVGILFQGRGGEFAAFLGTTKTRKQTFGSDDDFTPEEF